MGNKIETNSFGFPLQCAIPECHVFASSVSSGMEVYLQDKFLINIVRACDELNKDDADISLVNNILQQLKDDIYEGSSPSIQKEYAMEINIPVDSETYKEIISMKYSLMGNDNSYGILTNTIEKYRENINKILLRRGFIDEVSEGAVYYPILEGKIYE